MKTQLFTAKNCLWLISFFVSCQSSNESNKPSAVNKVKKDSVYQMPKPATDDRHKTDSLKNYLDKERERRKKDQ